MYCLCHIDDPDQVIFRLELAQRPWTTNTERTEHHFKRAERTKNFRDSFHYLARSEKIPPMIWLSITAEPHQKGGVLADVGACNPAVKAAIDGLVDAKVLPDDSSIYLKSLIFLPPIGDRNSLVLYLRGVKR